MHYQNETNIILSGHISSGTTITALILAYLLQKKFVYAGGTHKFISDKLGYDSTSEEFLEYEKKYGEKWDVIWEKYISWKVNNERNLLVNGKLAGFFAENKPWLFEAFITANPEVRMKRAGSDSRTEDITARDNELNERWKKLFDVNFMNLDEVRENHDLLIDNSNLTISQTVFQIYKVMREALGLRERLLESDIKKVEMIAQKEGKNFFYKKLEEKKLLITPTEIFKDWIENFEDDLEQTAKEWRDIVYMHAENKKIQKFG